MKSRTWRNDETREIIVYLMAYVTLKQRRDALMWELERQESATMRASARLNLAGTTGQQNPTARENDMLRVVDSQTQLKNVIADIDAALAERLRLIEHIPDENQKTLLTLRFVNGKTWEEIGYTMHYERTQIFKIRGNALDAAEALYQPMTA